VSGETILCGLLVADLAYSALARRRQRREHREHMEAIRRAFGNGERGKLTYTPKPPDAATNRRT